MKAVVLTGGPGGHPFKATAGHLAAVLEAEGFRATVADDVEECLAALGGCSLLAVNALRWQMLDDRYAAARPAHGFRLSRDGREAVTAFVARGGALLASHTAAICFDDWPGWGQIVGASWVWGRSHHPPIDDVRVEVAVGAHPITSGVPAVFDVVDEVYCDLEVPSGAEPLAWGTCAGVRAPVLWAREGANGSRVVYDALGHDLRSLAAPAHDQILHQAVRWLRGA